MSVTRISPTRLLLTVTACLAAAAATAAVLVSMSNTSSGPEMPATPASFIAPG